MGSSTKMHDPSVESPAIFGLLSPARAGHSHTASIPSSRAEQPEGGVVEGPFLLVLQQERSLHYASLRSG